MSDLPPGSIVPAKQLRKARLTRTDPTEGLKEARGHLKQIRLKHHRAAKLLANGASVKEVSALTGLSTARLYWLKSQDPAFMELIAHYKGVSDAVFEDLAVLMKGVSEDALERLRERLETAPEKFSNEELLKIVKTLADRAGYGPTRTENRNVRHIEGLAEAMTKKVIDAEVVSDE